jgi:predicted transcriptional regulator
VGETHTDETLLKARNVLKDTLAEEFGLSFRESAAAADNVIRELLNAGLLIRERTEKRRFFFG